MKIIVPVIKLPNSTFAVAQSFQDASHACVYDHASASFEWEKMNEFIKNPGNITLELKLKGIYDVLCLQMPFLALKFFTESNISVHKAISIDVEQNIQFLLNNKLSLFINQNLMAADGCAGLCSSCSDCD
ncbi:MAG: hypothetical protein HC819_20100 [Cyclobacteriaceae bacterium]|nr:hypothetical protein [Cyclobacteriaceae bacterium]